jgi:HPt (histidine-containing phosphotransfer) domain-containing protein
MISNYHRFESLWKLIKQLDSSRILTAISLCSNMQKKLEQAWEYLQKNEKNPDAEPVVLNKTEWRDLMQAAHQISQQAKSLGLHGIPKACADVIETVKELNGTNGVLSSDFVYRSLRYVETMSASFINAMDDVHVSVLSGESIRYIASTEPLYGEAVEMAFPLSSEDIADAGRSLGYGLNTAVAFHLMRAMELTIQILAAKLGFNNVDKVWGKLLADINEAIMKMAKGRDRDAWSECHSHLYHVKQAWRNPTMHPKKTYTDAEAKALFDAVGSFMRHLAPLVEAEAQ